MCDQQCLLQTDHSTGATVVEKIHDLIQMFIGHELVD
jgi:hypothetical protein